jgi:sugar-specific transcriptional regulator TrmB
MELAEPLKNIGLSDKAARLYLASLEMGEATVQDLARHSGINRTSIYYVLRELTSSGALVATRRGRKMYYLAQEPRMLLKHTKEKLAEFEESIKSLEERKHPVASRPRVDFLYGPAGFKAVWDMLFALAPEEYLIITNGEDFLDFVKEKYIVSEIITTKRKLGIVSRQLITDSPYAREIVAKDMSENRTSKLLPPRYPLQFTEIICDEFVAFISPRIENLIIVIENESFAKTRASLFHTLWNALPKP